MQIWASLPNFLQRQIHCHTEGEAAFALFLKALRDAGRLDDPLVDPSLAAQSLGEAARILGASKSAALSCIATNGRVLVATRHGSEALAYRLLEGSAECARCGLDAKSPDLPLVRAHRRRKTVAIASHVTRPASWIEIPDATALLIGRGLNIQRLPI
jgi:glutamine amidotransferase